MSKKKHPSIKQSAKQKDLLIIISLILIAIPITFLFQLKLLEISILFFVVPALYLLYSRPKSIKRITTAALGTIFATFTIDFFAVYNNVWYVPQNHLVLPFRIFGVLPIDDLLAYMAWILFVAVFYEHFIDHDRSDVISARFKYAFGASFFSASILALTYLIRPAILHVPYAYLLLLTVNLVFLMVFSVRHFRLLIKFLKAVAFFFPLLLLLEFVALATGQWSFPGQYVMQLSLFGFIFPLEELMLWITVSTLVVLMNYESFIDDGK